MALLNKLFFPSAPTPPTPTLASTTTPTAAIAAATSIVSQPTSLTTPTNAARSTLTAAPTFGTKRTQNQAVHSKNYRSQFPFDGRQVRILLYRECDSRGRRLLFDSNALQKVPLNDPKVDFCRSEKHVTRHVDEKSHIHTNGNLAKDAASSRQHKYLSQQQQQQKQTTNNKAHSSNFIEVCAEYGYKHNRPNSNDITTIGEMVFGALAMSFRGTALKVHWLPEPSRILCSQLFLAPTGTGNNGHSPYSTVSMNSLLATPRTSISSEHGSIDGLSMNSFSMPFSVSVGRQMSLTPSDRTSMMMTTCPLDVPDQQSMISTNSSSGDSGPRYSSTYSNATDSGYSGMSSRGQYSSGDQWSYQYSTRSSLGSVLSDQSNDPLRKLSLDSTGYPSSPHLDEFASDGCLQRRISRNLRTSFEYEHSRNDLIGFLSDNYTSSGATVTTNGSGGSEGGSMGVPNYRRASYCANESRSNPEIGKRRDASMKLNSRRAKLGLAVCITMSESFEEEMELFCSEHIALLESMLSRLRASTERAYINHKDFLQIMYQAWHDAQQWLNDLFTAPRIKCPVWLSITTSGSKYSKNVAERFIKELCFLLSFADTKDTNFFISTMLTAILTHHLGWVATVSAFNSSSSRSETSAAAIEQRAKLLQVSHKHPYNALWAQLGDLYGAIGIPPKLARTIIYGTEKLSVEKLLNVLTYFIRCGEVRRTAKREDFNKELVNSAVCQNNNEKIKKSNYNSPHANRGLTAMKKSNVTGGTGMTRTMTCKQNLNAITDSCDIVSSEEEGDSSTEEVVVDMEYVRTLKKNEIPTVLAFRDSRFVQQELRIGNYLMDTGIEKKSLLVKQAAQQQLQLLEQQLAVANNDGRIRLTITTPDNIEMLCMEDDSNSSTCTVGNSSLIDGAVEAIEIDTVDASATAADATTNIGNISNAQNKTNFFWESIKEGLSISDLEKLQQGVKLINRKLDRRASSFNIEADSFVDNRDSLSTLDKRMSHLSLSDLITQNSMGKGDRMTWGIEPIKENVSLEEQIHFDFCQKLIERDHGICRQTDKGVVFVLGDNEPLINLKKSTEDLANEFPDAHSYVKPMLCTLHQRAHDPMLSKKHSGVKFNFEQYPQIATNYMKSKNLVMTNYELLMDKCTKLEASESSANSNGSKVQHTCAAKEDAFIVDSCAVCSSLLRTYQTPSNATELEFEEDEVHCHQNAAVNIHMRPLHSVGSAASIDTLKSTPHVNESHIVAAAAVAATASSITTTAATVAEPTATTSGTFTRKSPKRVSSQRSSISSVAAKCAAAVNESTQHILKLPVPGVKELPQEDEPPGEKLRAGFIPSLFLNVNDHYISDMVLQGTCATPNSWEFNLREDLALAAHSASLISQPAENIAIVADMEKWDVRLISSQAQHFPYAGGQSSPVGMSQLVSSMLETVQAMNASGIAAYECLSYLESKLQEIYLQSETLAAFLLETDFCPLSAVTTALHLSENDVPLLLSIASIHTPKISRKCGISFR